MKNYTKPNILLLGPTGSGKTYLLRNLAAAWMAIAERRLAILRYAVINGDTIVNISIYIIYYIYCFVYIIIYICIYIYILILFDADSFMIET